MDGGGFVGYASDALEVTDPYGVLLTLVVSAELGNECIIIAPVGVLAGAMGV